MTETSISPQAKALFDQFRLMRPQEHTPVSLEVERENTQNAEELTGVPRGVRFERAVIAGVSGIWCIPAADAEKFLCVYLHGGAFGLMSAMTHSRMGGHLANACAAKVFVPDYRLAPEHPFPAGLEDCAMVVETIMRNEDGLPVALSGDSAGGGLAVSTTLMLLAGGKPAPFCMAIMSPWLDLAHKSPSLIENATRDDILSMPSLVYFAELYLAGTDPENPLASPLYADCRALPPTYIQSAECDLVRDDALRFADRLGEAGVRTKIDVFGHMQHSFQFFAGRIPEADEALRRVAGYMNDVLGQTA